ncbi:universal stress protein [Stetteria hydrogenophila]
MAWLDSALVGIDLSGVSGALASWLPQLGRLGTRRVYLLHVVPADIVEAVSGWYPTSDLESRLVGDARRELEGLARSVAAGGLEVEVLDPAVGVPGEELVQAARRVGAGFVVVASRGHGLLRRILLGSTAEEVAASSDRPVLVARVQIVEGRPVIPALSSDPVVAAVTGDEYAARVAETAGDAAAALGSRVILVHALHRGEDAGEAQRLLDDLKRRLEARGVRAEARLAEGEHPCKAVKAVAVEARASLVVAGQSERPRERRLGPIAACLLARSPTHVLIAGQPEPQG